MIVSLFICWRPRGVKFPDISSNDLSSWVAKHLLCGLVDPGDLDIDIDINIVILDIDRLIQVTLFIGIILIGNFLSVFFIYIFIDPGDLVFHWSIYFIVFFWSDIFYPGDLVLAVGDLDNVPHVVQRGEEALRVA